MMSAAPIHELAQEKAASQLKEMHDWIQPMFFSKAAFTLKQLITQLWTPAWRDKNEHFTML